MATNVIINVNKDNKLTIVNLLSFIVTIIFLNFERMSKNYGKRK